MTYRRYVVLSLFAAAATVGLWIAHEQAQAAGEVDTLQVGETAEDVELETLGGERIKLSDLTHTGPVVLAVLRGYPGYQCPICSRQVGTFRRHVEELTRLHTKVVFVYPGPADGLKQRAEEFLEGDALPEPLTLVIDPDYSFTNQYDLRWDAPRETAYPSTFVLDTNRVVRFRTVSTSHGGRADTNDVLATLAEIQGASPQPSQ